MNSTHRKKSTVLLASLFLIALATETGLTQSRPLPNPVLYLTGTEAYTANGKEWIRYNYGVLNYDSYPTELFAAAPELPPCGVNTKSSRTWVDIYDQSGKRLYGFCALGKPADMNKIWFALEPDVVPPSWIYIEMNDRKTSTKYKSNLADTSM